METERLILRRQTLEDAPFIMQLVNDPDWLRFIGDRGVRTVEDARRYIENGAMEIYRRYGFCFYLTELKRSGEPIGICGLTKRDSLEDVDIGYAFLPKFRGQGYASEAASAVLDYGQKVLGLKRIVAITSKDNVVSSRLLEKIGLRFERLLALPPDGEEVRLFATNHVDCEEASGCSGAIG